MVVFMVTGGVCHRKNIACIQCIHADFLKTCEFMWLCSKQICQLLLCCISDNVAAQWMFPKVLNHTCCYHGNHACQQKLMDCKFWSVSFLTILQISDFLSGRLPLTIKLGIGAHVMYVQLQLSAQNVAELQQHRDLRAGSSSELQTGLPTAARMSHPDSSTNATGSATLPASQSSTVAQDSSDSTSSIQMSTQRPRTSHSLTTAPPHQSYPPRSTRYTSSPVLSTPSLPSGCPHPSCPLPAATPICSPAPTCSIPGPQSPAPASTFKEVSQTYSTAKVNLNHNALSWFQHYVLLTCISNITCIISHLRVQSLQFSTVLFIIVPHNGW